MKKRETRIFRMRAVIREYRTAEIALGMLANELRRNPSLLNQYDLQFLDFKRFRHNVEPTFLIRVYAEFEGGIRDFWTAQVRQTYPPMAVLMDAIAAKRNISANARRDAHEVRDYRNSLLHETAPTTRVEIEEAGRKLIRFFSFLPAHW